MMRIIFFATLFVLIVGLTACSPEWQQTESAASKADYKGDKEKAKELYMKAFNQAEANDGALESIVNKITGLPNVSFAEKEDFLKRSLKQGEKSGETSKVVERRLDYLMSFYEYNNPPRYAEAEIYGKRLLANSLKVYGPDDPFFDKNLSRKDADITLRYPSEWYQRLAPVLEKQGKFSEAEPLRRRNVAILEKKSKAPLLRKPVNTYWNKKWLADNLRAQGKTAEAYEIDKANGSLEKPSDRY